MQKVPGRTELRFVSLSECPENRTPGRDGTLPGKDEGTRGWLGEPQTRRSASPVRGEKETGPHRPQRAAETIRSERRLPKLVPAAKEPSVCRRGLEVAQGLWPQGECCGDPKGTASADCRSSVFSATGSVGRSARPWLRHSIMAMSRD